jgi:hypothetical protein
MSEPVTNLKPDCAKKNIPLWLVLSDNIPTLILFILGALIISRISASGAIIYFLYCLSSVVFFWARICPYCHHYNTLACPCGYGAISARLFKSRNDKSFRKVFRQNIGIVFPDWFIPLAGAIYILIKGYNGSVLVLTIAFCLTGFVIIPLISKYLGCKNCQIKEDCPWMNAHKKTYNKPISDP